jgi:hypothetical protein
MSIFTSEMLKNLGIQYRPGKKGCGLTCHINIFDQIKKSDKISLPFKIMIYIRNQGIIEIKFPEKSVMFPNSLLFILLV